MNPAIVANLTRAGLLDLAERTAKRHELRLRDVISRDDVTGGHIALWRALAEHKSAAELSAILGWPEPTIAAHVPKVPPAPPSQVRAKPLSRAESPAPAVDVAALIEAAVAPLRAEVAELRRLAMEQKAMPAKLAAPATRPRAAPDPVESPEQHLARFGTAGQAVLEAVSRAGVSPADLLSGRRSPGVVHARREAVRVLTEQFRMSQTEVGRILRVDPASVYAAQRKLGVRAAHKVDPARKAAA